MKNPRQEHLNEPIIAHTEIYFSAKKKQWLTFLQENNGFLSSSVHEEVGVKVLTKGMNGLKKKRKQIHLS